MLKFITIFSTFIFFHDQNDSVVNETLLGLFPVAAATPGGIKGRTGINPVHRLSRWERDKEGVKPP